MLTRTLQSLFLCLQGHWVEAVKHGETVQNIGRWEQQKAILVELLKIIYGALGIFYQHYYSPHKALEEEVNDVNNNDENNPSDYYLLFPVFFLLDFIPL